MTTSPYTEYLRHHYETQSTHGRAGRRQTDRLLAPWRRHKKYNPTSAYPQSR
ncbi:MAG: hypothetical protein H0U15_14600 [Geodermatophilaceae bacterium]|nr:hypothetical protein [Geodermatophilaceae bacterium]